MVSDGPVERLIGGYDSPEGPAFDRQGNLYFVNWLSSSIVRLTPDGQASEWHNTGGIPAGLAFHRDGDLYIADEGDVWHGLLRLTPSGEQRVVVDQYRGRSLNGANDLIFDAAGRLYFSDPWGSSLERPLGAFYRWWPEGRLEQLDRGLAFPNGVALSPDGAWVYLAETWTNRLWRYAIDAAGRVGPRQPFAQLSGSPGPDGMAVDEAGYLYVAHWSGGRLDVVAPEGAVVDRIVVPGANPTNCAFGGPDRRTLVISEVATGALYRVRTRRAGLALFGEAG
jgi:gluconolactonase